MLDVTVAEWQAFFADPSEVHFTPLYEATRQRVYTFCMRILRNREDAEDAFQATYARLLLLAHRHDPAAFMEDPIACLGHLALREAGNLRKSRKRKAEKEKTMAEPPDTRDPAAMPDQVVADRQFRDQVMALTAQLPERERLALELHFFNGLSQYEIARLLNLSQGAISQRIRKGIERLRPMMRRSGLGEASAVAVAMTGTGTLLNSSTSAAVIFTQAQAAVALLTAGTAAGFAGGAITKTIIGVATVKAKIAVLSVAALIIASTALTLKFHKDSTSPIVKPSVVATPQDKMIHPQLAAVPVEPATAATVSLVSNLEPKADPAVLKTESQATSNTVDLRVRVIWQEDRQPVKDASVVLVRKSNPEMQDISVQTDAKGEATLPCPADKKKVWVEAHHPQGGDVGRLVAIPSPGTCIFELPKGATLTGYTFLAATGAPLPEAEVWTVPVDRTNRMNRRIKMVKSDGQGHFEITCIGDAKVLVKARQNENVTPLRPKDEKPVDIVMGQTNGPISVTLEKGQSIRGVVRDVETKKPIEQATIKSGDRQTRTAADGSYALDGFALQQTTFVASAEGHAKTSADVVFSESGSAVQNFELDPAETIRVEVVDENDVPVAGALINATYLSRPAVLIEPLGKTDEYGMATFKNISRMRRTILEASKTGYESVGTTDVKFGQSATQRIRLKSIGDTMRCIVGTVTDSQNKPIQGAEIEWLPGDSSRNVRAYSDANGRYTIEAPNENPGCDLGFSSRGYAPRFLEAIVAGSKAKPRTVDITLQAGHWLEGRALDEQGKLVKGVRVYAMTDPNKLMFAARYSGTASKATTDAEGHFRLEDLTGPTCAISLRITTRDYEELNIDEAEVDRSCDFTLKKARVIRGKVIDAATRKPVTAFQLGQMNGSKPTNFNSDMGNFELTQIERTGEHDLLCTADGYQPATVANVQAILPSEQQEIVIELSKGKTIEGTIVEAATGKPVANVPVFHGYPSHEDWISWDERSLMEQRNAQKTLTDASGRFSLVEGEPGTIYVMAEGYQYVIVSPKDREQLMQGASGLKIALITGATVTCATSQAELGDLVSLCIRQYCQPRKTPRPGWSGIMDANLFQQCFNGHVQYDATATWQNLPAGEYQLYYNTNKKFGGVWYTEDFRIDQNQSVHLDLNSKMGTLQLKGHIVTARNDPQPNTYVVLKPLFDWSASFLTWCKNGDFVIDGLRPGAYSLECQQDLLSGTARTLTTITPLEIRTNTQRNIVIPER